MVIALLLAQLVLPGPPSGPIQPPGMICASGGCEGGPVVYWTSADRGRLVVACDMRSDTCSDGRKITTERATPVPCETSPGVWETVGVDEGCYGVRGLESWAQNTSYLSWGAELDRGAWGKLGGAAVAALPGGGYRVSGGSVQNVIPLTVGEERTAACILRAAPGSPSQATMYSMQVAAGGKSCVHTLTDQWATYTCNSTATASGSGGVILTPPAGASVDVLACWSVRSPTPGRPCWGGEAPVTCDTDRHTISTEGWPTERGEISLVYTPQDVSSSSSAYLVNTTGGGAGQPSGFYLYRISESGALVFGLRRGDTSSGQSTGALVWEKDHSYHIRVRWSPERAEIWRDGVLLRSWVPAVVPDSHPGTAAIGTTKGGSSPAQGSARSLTVRNYEEVSP